MSPDRFPKQAGAGLPLALFVITVLALIVAGMAQLQQSTAGAVSLQVQSQRAFYAAESGVQVGVYNVLNNNSCASAGGALDFNNGALSNCAANLNCSSRSSGGITVFTVTSRGVCGAGPDRAERTIEVRVR